MRMCKAGKLAIAISLLNLASSGMSNALDNSNISYVDVEFTEGGQSELTVKVEIDPVTQNAQFFYFDDLGDKRFFDPMYEGSVSAHQSNDGINLIYDGTEIGLITSNKLYLCDRFLVQGKQKTFPCNANFYTPQSAPSKIDYNQLGSQNYSMDLSLANLPESLDKGTPDKRIDLSRFAQKQINQYATGTCAYNAATGIMEILFAMKTGKLVDFSEPYFLVNAPPSYGEDWFWKMYERISEETKSLTQDQYLPVKSIYKSNVKFRDAKKSASDRLRQNRTPVVPLPYAMRGEKIFWHGKWNNSPTDEDDFENTIKWFQEHRMPVNLHHVVNGYWHSVVLIGYDPSTEKVLIKDSLGNTHIKGTWKSKSWFIEYAYGAIGVTTSQIQN